MIRFIRKNFTQIFKFGLVGVMNTLVYYVIYYLLLQVGLNFVVAATSGTIIGLINSYFWNKFFVFKAKQRISAGEIVKFLVVYGVQYLFNLAIIYVCITFIGLSAELAGLIAAALCPIVSYTGLKFWGFRKKESAGGEEDERVD